MSRIDRGQLAVFARNHRRHLDEAVALCANDPDRLVTFRASRTWASAARALTSAPPVPIYIAPWAVPEHCRSVQAGLSKARLPEQFRGRHPRADPLELFDGHAVEAALAAGLLDGPDDHAPDERGDFFMRSAAASSQAMVFGGSGPYSIIRPGGFAPPDPHRRRSRGPHRPAPLRRGRGWREGGTRRTCLGCGCRGDLRPSDRRSSRRPGRGSPRSGRSSRTLRIARRARCGGECRRTAPRRSRGPRDSWCEGSPRRPGGMGKG